MVLLEGDSGTGKEVCAEAIHRGLRHEGNACHLAEIGGTVGVLMSSSVERLRHFRLRFAATDQQHIRARLRQPNRHRRAESTTGSSHNRCFACQIK